MAEVRIAEGLGGLRSLKAEWEHLHRASSAGLFQSFDWAEAWAQSIGTFERAIRILTVTDGDRGCIVPLIVQRHLGVRRLRWLGVEVTDYCDVLASGAWDIVDLAAAIRSHLPPADIVELRQIRTGSLASRIFNTADQPDMSCPYITVAESRFPKDILYAERRAAASGKLTYEVATDTASRADIAAFVIAQKRLALSRQGRNTAEFDLTVTPFLRSLAELEFLPVARPYFSRLILDGQTMAAQIAFIEGATLLYYLPAFDFAHRLHSPGHLLMLNLLRDAAAMGLRTVDLLRGEEPYKFKWTTSTRVLSRAGWPVTLRGRAFAFGQRIKKRL
jgi:CelD/BcsL family acetyltransferase involved in cellulose biosynthesis